MPRTTTVSVCVPALPPMPGDDRHEHRQRRTWSIVPSNSATTAAARNAVTRLTNSHGSRLRSDSSGGVNTPSSADTPASR